MPRLVTKILIQSVITVVVFAAILWIGILIGRDAERVATLRAEPTAPVVRIGPNAARARIEPQCPERIGHTAHKRHK